MNNIQRITSFTVDHDKITEESTSPVLTVTSSPMIFEQESPTQATTWTT